MPLCSFRNFCQEVDSHKKFLLRIENNFSRFQHMLKLCEEKTPRVINIDRDGYNDLVSYLHDDETNELYVQVSWGLPDGEYLPPERVATLRPENSNACEFTMERDPTTLIFQYPNNGESAESSYIGVPFPNYVGSRWPLIQDRELQDYQEILNDLARNALFDDGDLKDFSGTEKMHNGTFDIVLTIQNNEPAFQVTANFSRLSFDFNAHAREQMLTMLNEAGISPYLADGIYVFQTHIQFDEDQQVFVYSTEIVDPILY